MAKQNVTLNVSDKHKLLATSSVCDVYVATSKLTGVTKIVLTSANEAVFIDPDGYLGWASKDYLDKEYILRHMRSDESITIRGKN